MKKTGLLFLVLTLLSVGCQSANPGEAGASNNASADSNASAPAGTELTIDSLPSELKHDAFEYYGLGRVDPLKMQIKPEAGAASEGTQTVKLTKLEGGKAEFSIEHTDGLAQLGTMTIVLEKDGLRSAKNEQIDPDPATWELPAGLTPGKTWETKTLSSSSLKLNGTNKLEGTKEVTTPVGTYKDALLVTFTGSGEQGAEKFKLTTKMWLVKGRGTVKSELERSANGKTTKIVLEEVK